MELDNETKVRVESVFKERMIGQGIKYESSKFFTAQVEYFSGACAVLNQIPVSWGIALMSNRPIIDKY